MIDRSFRCGASRRGSGGRLSIVSNRRNPRQHVRPMTDDGAAHSVFTAETSYAPGGRARERSQRKHSRFQLRGIYWVIGAVLVGGVWLMIKSVSAGGAAHAPPTAVPIGGQSGTLGPAPTLSLDIKPWNGQGRFTVL